MPVTLHHLDQSRSQRILWLLEELGIDYQIVQHKRRPDRLAPRSLRDVHPLGKAPVIEDDGKVIAESGAIVEYLIKRYGNGRFVASEERQLDDSFWSHFAEGSLMPTLVLKLIFGIIPSRTPFLIRPIARGICSNVSAALVDPDAKAKLDLVTSHLRTHPGTWLAGGDAHNNPTAADFQMSFPLEAVTSGRVDPDVVGPEIREYVERVHARPAYRRALEKGGPYDYAKL